MPVWFVKDVARFLNAENLTLCIATLKRLDASFSFERANASLIACHFLCPEKVSRVAINLLLWTNHRADSKGRVFCIFFVNIHY
jgi:hypothetical protein